MGRSQGGSASPGHMARETEVRSRGQGPKSVENRERKRNTMGRGAQKPKERCWGQCWVDFGEQEGKEVFWGVKILIV